MVGVGFFVLEKNAVDISVFENYKTAQPSVVLDDEGQVLARFELDKRATVSKTAFSFENFILAYYC